MQIMTGVCECYKGDWVSNNGPRRLVRDNNSPIHLKVQFNGVIARTPEQFLVQLSKLVKKEFNLSHDVFVDRKSVVVESAVDIPDYSENFEAIY